MGISLYRLLFGTYAAEHIFIQSCIFNPMYDFISLLKILPANLRM